VTELQGLDHGVWPRHVVGVVGNIPWVYKCGDFGGAEDL